MLSVIVPISEFCGDIESLYQDYKSGIEGFTNEYELIFVLDGPREDTLAILKELSLTDAKIKIIQLAKWFGESTALTAGIEQSVGEIFLVLPSYSQVDASQIPDLLEQLDQYDMVVANRYPRKDPWANRIQGAMFNWLTRKITDSNFRDLGCAVRAFKRSIVEEVPIYGDQHRFFPLLAEVHGFSVKEVNLKQASEDRNFRLHKLGVYPRRLMDLFAVFFLAKFTKKPLRFFGLIGVATFSVGAFLIAFIVTQRLFFDIELAARPALLLSSLMVVLGIQIIALGLIGELIIYTHAHEIKEYKVKKIIN